MLWDFLPSGENLCGDDGSSAMVYDPKAVAKDYGKALSAGEKGVPHYCSRYEKRGKPRFDLG